jgi:cytochrome c553
MKTIISLLLALPTAILVAAFSVGVRARDADMAAGSREYLQAKIGYCEDCHGQSGQGYVAFLVMPRLAGQTTTYLENQLRAFAEGQRDRALFLNMAKIHGVTPVLRAALAAHFRDANPRPFGGGPRHLAAGGRRIYEDGVPEANIPACSACHGPDAQGQGANPRLAGQLYPYLISRLSQFPSEYRRRTADVDPTATMARIAHNLTRSQMAAVAAYVSGLKIHGMHQSSDP